MKKIDVGQSIGIIANIGVIAGIVFLAIEIQQNTAAVKGSTYQALADGAAAQSVNVSTNSVLAGLLGRVYGGATRGDFTTAENSQIWYHYNAILQRLENSYFQYTSGLADDRVFESYGWNDGIFDTTHFADYWNFFGAERNTSAEFRKFFEGRVGLSFADGNQ